MKYLSVAEAAGIAGVSRRYVYKGLRDGRLHGAKLAGEWRFRLEWIEDWVEGRTAKRLQEAKVAPNRSFLAAVAMRKEQKRRKAC